MTETHDHESESGRLGRSDFFAFGLVIGSVVMLLMILAVGRWLDTVTPVELPARPPAVTTTTSTTTTTVPLYEV